MVEDFDEWYERVRPPMAAALGAWCGDESLAADAIDEAFVRAVERWDRVRRMASPAGWVWRTATNVARRRARRAAFEQRVLGRRTGEQRAHGDGALELDLDLDLRAALLALTERQRTAVVLHHIVDLPVSEVAAALGVAPGTASATLHQARTRLATLLGDDDTPAPAARRRAAPITRTDGVLP